MANGYIRFSGPESDVTPTMPLFAKFPRFADAAPDSCLRGDLGFHVSSAEDSGIKSQRQHGIW